MNNLHRELAPIPESAWKDLGDQVHAAFVLNAGARRVVDMLEPKGPTLGNSLVLVLIACIAWAQQWASTSRP